MIIADSEMFYRRPYLIRRAAQRGKEITLPPDGPFKPGEKVIAIYDGFILLVPKGAIVDEELLVKAIKTETKAR